MIVGCGSCKKMKDAKDVLVMCTECCVSFGKEIGAAQKPQGLPVDSPTPGCEAKECCCKCQNRMKLMEETTQIGWVCWIEGMMDFSVYLNTKDGHGQCELFNCGT